MDRAEKRLNLPLPEMTFGNNSLTLQYSPSQSSTSLAASDQDKKDDGRGKKEHEVSMRFNGLDALAEVGVGEGWEERTGGGVLVSMAESWGKNRLVPILSLFRAAT
jgi:type 2A phosphatase activator TIP41